MLKKERISAALLLLVLPFGAVSCSSRASDSEIKNYIASHPEEILDSLTKYRDKSIKQVQDNQALLMNKTVKRFSKSGGVAINPNGNIDIIEVMDYNCIYCKISFEKIQNNLKTKWSDVKLTLIPMPILNNASRTAVLLTRKENLARRETLALVSSLMKENQINDESTRKVAKKLSIEASDLEKLSPDLDKDMQIANALSIKATPTFIVEGHIFMGFKEDNIEAAITAARVSRSH